MTAPTLPPEDQVRVGSTTSDVQAEGGGALSGVVVRGRAQRLLDAGCGGAAALLVLPTTLPLFAGGGAVWLVLAAVIPIAVVVATVLAGGDASTGTPVPGDEPAVPRAAFGPWARVAADVVGTVILLALIPADGQGRSALADLASGGARLVTAALPASASGPELGAAVVATALAAGAGAELGLRARSSLAPALPAVLLYIAAVAVGVGGLPAPTWGAVLLLAGLAVAAILHRLAPLARSARGPSGPVVAGGRRERPPIPWRALGAGAGLVVVVAALAVPLGDALPGSSTSTRYDLRASLRPAVPPPPGLNPLVDFASRYDGPPTPVMDVAVDGADATSLYWRLDTLDHFTGTTWTSTYPLLPAGTTLPPGSSSEIRTTPVTAAVRLQSPSSYLPSPNRPTSVSASGLRVDPVNGVLAVGGSQPQALSYRLRVAVPAPTADQLLYATPAPVDDPGGAAPSATVANVVSSLIRSVQAEPFARLTAIQHYLTTGGFTHHAPGHSPIGAGDFQVQQLLISKDGSSEQYAAAFALLVRALGYEARIVVGYHGGTPQPNGDVAYTTRDLTVWPEVLLAGIGWQPFPVVPATGSGAARPTPAPSSPLNQALQHQTQVNSSPTQPPSPTGTGPARPAPAHHSGGLGWVLIPIVIVAVAVVLIGGLILGKWVRRRRQAATADPGLKVDGAWDCVLDRLAEQGVDLVASLTVPEVVDRALVRCGPARVGPLPALVEVVDARRYNRRVPPSPEVAERAWSQTVQVERALRHGVPVRSRVRAVLSPAPFFRPLR